MHFLKRFLTYLASRLQLRLADHWTGGIFDELRGCSLCRKYNETMYQVFDIFSQLKVKLRRKRKYKIVKINSIQIIHFENKCCT